MRFGPSDVLAYGLDVLTHDLGVERRRPTFVNFSVSNRCNAMCRMCDIWRYPSDDAQGEALRRIFASPTLRRVRALGLTGGEPFLRADLPDIVEAALAALPRLRSISITTNGFNTRRIEKSLARILAATAPAGVGVEVTVSVDGLGPLHERIRGVPGVWRKVEDTLDMLQAAFADAADINVACTISRDNAGFEDLCALDDYMRARGLRIKYRTAVTVRRIYNERLIDEIGLVPRSPEATDVRRFLARVLDAERLRWRHFYYAMIGAALAGRPSRTIKCREKRDGGMLDSNGDFYVCSVSGHRIGNLADGPPTGAEIAAARRAVRATFCDGCLHDHASHVSPLRLLGRLVAGE